MKLVHFWCFIVMATLSASCHFTGKRIKGNGNLSTETRKISTVNKIDLVGDIDVVLKQGETMVKVEGDENLLRYIVTRTNNGWLEVRTEDDVNLSSDNKLVVYVTTPAISKIKVTGSGNLNANSKFSGDDEMELSVTGSGNLTIPVHVPRVDASIAGSGNLNTSGETRYVKISIAGSGNFNGNDLKAENANISIAGSGSAYIYADVNLKASIMGSGDVHYKGNASVNKNVMGSGTVARVQ